MTIGVAGTYTVTLATAEVDTAATLSITDTTATVALNGTANLTIGSTLANAGILDVDSTAGDSGATLTAVTLTNSGTATFGNTTQGGLVTVNLGTLNNAASGTLDLLGASGKLTTVNVNSAVTNNGILSIAANSTLSLAAGKTFTQSGAGATTTVAGTLSATNLTINGGTFTDTGTFTVAGTITVSAGSASFTTLAAANFAGGTLTGGTYKVEAAGTLTLPGAVTTLDATVYLIGASASAAAIESNLTTIGATGVLNIQSGHNFTDSHALTVDAPASGTASTLTIDSTSALTASAGLTIASSGLVSDAGALDANVTVDGTLFLAPTFTLGSGDSITGPGLLELVSGTGTGTITLVGSGTGIDVSNVLVKSGTWTVKAAPNGLPASSLTGSGSASTLMFTAAGGATQISLAGVSKFNTIDLFGGTNNFKLAAGALSSGPVTINGGTGPDTIDASAVTSGTLTFIAGATSTGDSFTGGAESDTVKGAAAALNGDTLNGGGGSNTIILNAAGTVDLSNASKFQTIDLFGGTAVTVGNATFSQNVVINGSTASSVSDHVSSIATSASGAKFLTYVMGSKTTGNTLGDTATGTGGTHGEIDFVKGVAAAVTGDTLTGSSANAAKNSLVLLSGGTVDLSNVSNFDKIFLSSSAGNTVTVSATTLTGTTDGTTPVAVTIVDGSSGTTLVQSSLTPGVTGQELIFLAGSKLDHFTGGAEGDIVKVSAAAMILGDVLDGGSTGDGNTLTMTTAGTFSLATVSNFGSFTLAAGTNVVTGIGHNMFQTGALTINGVSGNNTITSSDTTATDKLTYNAGIGSFTGDKEIDIVNIAAARAGLATLTGSSDTVASNVLNVTTTGAVNLTKDSNFGTINLTKGTNVVFATGAELDGTTVTATGATGTNNNTLVIDGASSAGAGSFSKGSNLLTLGSGVAGGLTPGVIYSVTGAGIPVGTTFTDVSGTQQTMSSNSTAASLTNEVVTVYAPIGSTSNTGSFAATSTALTLGSLLGSAFVANTIYEVTGAGIPAGTTFTTGATDSTSQTMSNSSTAAEPAENITIIAPIDLSKVAVMSIINLAKPGGAVIVVGDTTLLGSGNGKLTINDVGGAANAVNSTGTVSTDALTYVAANSGDTFVGGAEADVVKVSAANLNGADHLTGGSNAGTGSIAGGGNTLMVTTAGSFSLPFANVSGFGTIDLATGSSTVAVGGAAFIGSGTAAVLTIADGASGNNVINAASDTATGTLTYNATTGADYFVGGSENDVVNVATGRVGGDILTGGKASNTLNMTNPGGFSLGGVEGFGQSFTLGAAVTATDGAINLLAGNNSVVVTTGTLFGSLVGSKPAVTITAGATGANTISGRGAAGEQLVYVAGAGTTTFAAGAESDSFVFTNTTALQTIAGFDPTADKLGFYNSAFSLSSPTFANNFAENTTGDYASAAAGFNYNTSTGVLDYSATGSSSSQTHIATLTNHATIAASNVFFVA